MVAGSIENILREKQQTIEKLDGLLSARMKRSVKVEAEIRKMASAAAPKVRLMITRQQLMEWAIMLGVPEEMQLKGTTK